jgi:hypothetical protein
MRYLIVYRGYCDRLEKHNLDILYKNFINKIKNPLLQKNIDVDVVFSVYDTSKEHLEYLINLLDPILIYTHSSYNSTQIDQFMVTFNKVLNIYEDYNRIIFLRLDTVYKININKWNIWNNTGIFYTFREDNENLYKKDKLYSDIIIIIDKEYFLNLLYSYTNAYKSYLTDIYEPKYLPEKNGLYFKPFLPRYTLHNLYNITEYFFPIPTFTLVEGYYNSNTSHITMKPSPLHIILSKPYYVNDTYTIMDEN